MGLEHFKTLLRSFEHLLVFGDAPFREFHASGELGPDRRFELLAECLLFFVRPRRKVFVAQKRDFLILIGAVFPEELPHFPPELRDLLFPRQLLHFLALRVRQFLHETVMRALHAHMRGRRPGRSRRRIPFPRRLLRRRCDAYGEQCRGEKCHHHFLLRHVD